MRSYKNPTSQSARASTRGRRWAMLLPALAVLGLSVGCGGDPEVRVLVKNSETSEVVSGFTVTDGITGAELGETGTDYTAFKVSQDPADGTAKLFIRSPEQDGRPLFKISDPNLVFDKDALETGTPKQLVWVHPISEEEAVSTQSYVLVVSDPPGARYELGEWDVRTAGSPDEPDTFDLDTWGFFTPDSIYAFTFHKEGFDTLGMEMQLNRGRNDVVGTLVEETGITRWTVESKPAGADIFMDGEPTGEITPYTFIGLEPGAHTVRLTRKNYETEETTRVIRLGESASNQVTLTKVGASTFTNRYKVKTYPYYAEVYVDGGGNDRNQTGAGFEITLTEGKHKFRAVNTGLKTDVTFQYNVRRSDKPGKLLRLDLNTGRIGEAKVAWKKSYRVRVTSYYAEVYVDGDNINRNALGAGFDATLDEGNHRFRVVNEGLGIDRNLSYRVKRGDKAKTIVLDPASGTVRTE